MEQVMGIYSQQGSARLHKLSAPLFPTGTIHFTIVAMDYDNPLILKDVGAWRAWLDDNEETSDGVWLLVAKKGTTVPTSLMVADGAAGSVEQRMDRRPAPQPRRNNIPAALHSPA